MVQAAAQTNSKFRWLRAPDLNPRQKRGLNAGIGVEGPPPGHPARLTASAAIGPPAGPGPPASAVSAAGGPTRAKD